MNVTGKEAYLYRCCVNGNCGSAGDDGERYCIGPACIGWDWFDDEYEFARTPGKGFYFDESDAKPEGIGWEKCDEIPHHHCRYRRPHPARRGCCGRANHYVEVSNG